MRRGGPTRLGLILFGVIVAALLISVIFWIGSSLSGSGQSANQLTAAQKLLGSPSNKTSVKMIVRGPITAEENHYSLAATISSGSRNLTGWQGYDNKVIASTDFANSSGAFRDFLAVLNRQNFMNSQSSSLKTSGICASGQLITFQILDGAKVVGDLWTDSCDDGGTFAGNNGVINTILDQIPDSRNTIAGIKSKVGANTFSSENLFAL